MVVGNRMGVSAITGGPVETSVDLSERRECEGVTSIEGRFLDNVGVGDARGGVGLDCSIRHLLRFPR